IMSRITTTFSSDDAPIQASLARMQKDLDKLVDKNRKLVEESKKGSSAFQSGAADQTKSLGDLQRELLKATGHAQKMSDQQKKLNQTIGGTTDATQGLGAEFVATFSKGASGIASMIAGYVSLQSAMALVTAELDNIAERQKKAKDAQISEADAQAK